MIAPQDITSRYAAAVFPARHTVLGRDLAPFALGHLMLLQRFGSPFLSPKATPRRGDVALAAFLCTRDPLTAWSQIGTLRMRWFMATFARGLDRLQQARAELHAYLSAASHWPEFWIEGEQSAKSNQSPAIQTIRLQLMKHFGLGYMETLLVPWHMAVWDCIAHAELEGSVTISHKDECDLAEAAHV